MDYYLINDKAELIKYYNNPALYYDRLNALERILLAAAVPAIDKARTARQYKDKYDLKPKNKAMFIA